MIKELWQKYKLPTPANWRHFGNALVASAAVLTGLMSYVAADTILLRIVIGILLVGKFITEFATDKHD